MPKSVSCSVLLAAASFFIALSGCSNQTEKGSTPAGNQGQAATAHVRPPRNPLRNAYFGDLHLHSGYSMDAFAMGTSTTPDDAFRYAMGETVNYFGKPQKRMAALDFLALTDHAEYLGRRAGNCESKRRIRKNRVVHQHDQHGSCGSGCGLQEGCRHIYDQQTAAGIVGSQTFAINLERLSGHS